MSTSAGLKSYAIPLSWQFPENGVLHFLSSGKQTNGDYQTTLSALDWDNFYDDLHGGQFFDALRAHHEAELRLRPDRQPDRPQRCR